MMMKKFDAHCDVLWKMWEKSSEGLLFHDDGTGLQVNFRNMEAADVRIQCFAVFIPSRVPVYQRFHVALEMIDLFYQRIISDSQKIKVIKTIDDLKKAELKNSPRGALLTLEGAECLQGNLVHLRILNQLGVRSLGLTWNWRNEAADGVEEPSQGGLSAFGKELVSEAERLGIIIDVSHLSERGFWDLLNINNQPVIASHSNCMSVYAHRRNLNDEQIKAIIRTGGVIGLTFYPPFLTANRPAKIDHLLRHIERVCELGGEKNIGFGSDFDGIDQTMEGLKEARDYTHLEEVLIKYYSEELVEKFLFDNWQQVYIQALANVL